MPHWPDGLLYFICNVHVYLVYTCKSINLIKQRQKKINSKLSEKWDSVVYVLLEISKKCNPNPKFVIFRDFAKSYINIEDIIEDTINYIDSLVKEDCILEGL